MKKQVILTILDGWGVGAEDKSNPIHIANLETFNYIKQNYKVGALQASGIAVGLPWGEVGNSEVGHLTIGAGTVIYQHYPRITMAIQGRQFFSNQVLIDACNKAKENGGKLHLAGLLTEGHVHAAFEHIEALVELAKEQGVTNLYLHIFTDGKDGRPQAARELLPKLQETLTRVGIGKIASICGRHFSMDRDSHFDRTEAAYNVMTGKTPQTTGDYLQLIDAAYETGKTDESIDPINLLSEGSVASNDSLIFFNYREDSIRQIAASFINAEYDKFERQPIENLHVVTMTDYSKEFKVPVAFPQEDITMPLARVLSEAGKTQLQIAETEKYAHATYFFNGFRDESFEGQEKVLIPSNNVESHAEMPQMQAEAITTNIIEKINQGVDFAVANFANADIVAHTGNYEAELVAVQTIDNQIKRLVQLCEEKGVYLVITADHGNAEVLLDPITGRPETGHDPSPVPLYVIGPGMESVKTPEEARQVANGVIGVLSDVAPTILEIFGIPKPLEMKGESVLDILE